MISPRSRRSSLVALGLAPLALAVLAAGCSGSTTTQGEIVVAIQTDLSLPKDLASVRIQISTLGVVRFDNTYPVGPDPSMRIPATIGLLPGENPDAPIRIRVVGFKKEYQPRILREVITTVPPSRVVALRMPLQWLSDGSAHTDPLSSGDPNAFMSTCEDGFTNIGGDCVDSHVDSSSLPAYVPGDVFGGGDDTGAGGACFDTQSCFQGRAAGEPTTSADGSCVLPAPGGDPAQVNVAVELPAGGDGICADASGGGPCFVPLDRVDPAGGGLGWYTGTEATPTIHLPKALCAKLKSAGFAGHVVTSVRCPSKTPKSPTCGPWSSVQGTSSGGSSGADGGLHDGSIGAEDAPSGDTGANDASKLPQPQILAQAQSGASALVLDSADASSGNVVWTIAGAGIRYVKKDGTGGVQTPVAPLASTSSNAFHVARDGAGILDVTGYGTDTVDGVVWTYAPGPDGGLSLTPAIVSAGTPRGVAVVSGTVVWATASGVHTCSASNCAQTDLDVTYLMSSPAHPIDVAGLVSQGTYFATNGDSYVYTCSATGCDAFTLIAQNPGGGGANAAIVAADEGLYWIDEGLSGHVYAYPFTSPDGGTPSVTTLASGYDTSAPASEVHRGIAIDATFVYFTAGNGVFAVPKAGGAVIPLAAGLGKPTAIAVDGSFVYWSDFATQTIARTAKPALP